MQQPSRSAIFSREQLKVIGYTQIKISLPSVHPASPTLRRDAFDHKGYVFELKMDGFRALAQVGSSRDSGRGRFSGSKIATRPIASETSVLPPVW
jgi:hypothetical protein